jgi:hypothetical protein
MPLVYLVDFVLVYIMYLRLLFVYSRIVLAS